MKAEARVLEWAREQAAPTRLGVMPSALGWGQAGPGGRAQPGPGLEADLAKLRRVVAVRARAAMVGQAVKAMKPRQRAALQAGYVGADPRKGRRPHREAARLMGMTQAAYRTARQEALGFVEGYFAALEELAIDARSD